MPDTLQGLLVLALALLPGALYTWGLEREVGAWGVRLADRLLRFVGTSAILHALAAPVTYWIWTTWLHGDRLASGGAPLWLWAVPLTYVGLPLLLGTTVGRATRARRRWTRILTGPNPAPRAWDHLFSHGPDGWIRLRMKSGVWLAGAFATREDGSRSYASGYPEEPDLYLVETVYVDASTGEFRLDDEGRPIPQGSAMLVRWEEVEYLEFIEG